MIEHVRGKQTTREVRRRCQILAQLKEDFLCYTLAAYQSISRTFMRFMLAQYPSSMKKYDCEFYHCEANQQECWRHYSGVLSWAGGTCHDKQTVGCHRSQQHRKPLILNFRQTQTILLSSMSHQFLFVYPADAADLGSENRKRLVPLNWLGKILRLVAGDSVILPHPPFIWSSVSSQDQVR